MEGTKHLVSVIMASYNSEKYISEAISSVISQTYKHWELLVTDDCSSDQSVQVINHLKAKDKRIKLFKLSKNSGAAVARNMAIDKAQGHYIAFLDSDDKWLPQKLEKQVLFMQTHGYPFTHTAYELISPSGAPLQAQVVPPTVLDYKAMLYSNKIGCLTAIYDQSQLGKVYMPLLRKRQDYGLWLKILKTGEKAYCLPEILSQYRKTDNSMSSNKLNLIIWNWRLFRQVEQLSFIKSIYYLACNIVLKLKTK